MIRPAHDVAIGGIAIFVCWCAAVALAPETVTTAASEPPPAGPAAVVTTPARRIGDMQQVTPTVPPPPSGIRGLPYAPTGLAACDEMMFYANQFGLPAMFRSLGWRESNCRNEDAVETWCCHGYWQLHEMHVNDWRTGPRWMAECGVTSYRDFDSATPGDRQRQACATAVLLDIQGIGAWST